MPSRFRLSPLFPMTVLRPAPWLFGWLLLAPLPTLADDALIAEVQAFLYAEVATQGREVSIEVHPPSAHLPACESPEAFLPNASTPVMGRVSVGVRCGEGGQQVRYLQAEVGVIGSYPVLVREIAAGTEITQTLLEMRQGDLSRLPRRTIFEETAILGQLASRPIRAGTPLQTHQFHTRALVERGQQVVVEAAGASFRVTREGEALEAGGQGENIRVRFPDRQILTARVVGERRLSVDF